MNAYKPSPIFMRRRYLAAASAIGNHLERHIEIPVLFLLLQVQPFDLYRIRGVFYAEEQTDKIFQVKTSYLHLNGFTVSLRRIGDGFHVLDPVIDPELGSQFLEIAE